MLELYSTSEWFFFALFIAGVATLAVSLYIEYRMMQQRVFAEIAEECGLRFSYLSFGLPQRLGFLYQLDRGRNRMATNIISGVYKGFQVYVFDYRYVTGNKQDARKHHCSIAMLRYGQRLPEVRVYPPAQLEKFERIARFDRIEYHPPHDDFRKNFTVLTDNPEFAEQFLHPAMIEYLLRHPDMAVEAGGNWLCTTTAGPLIPEEVPRRLDQLIKILRVIPAPDSNFAALQARADGADNTPSGF